MKLDKNMNHQMNLVSVKPEPGCTFRNLFSFVDQPIKFSSSTWARDHLPVLEDEIK